MKRKVIKQGQGGLTIHLPKKWADQECVQAGDELSIEIVKKELRITAEDSRSKEKKINIDISDFDKTSFIKTFTTLYESGFDEIRFTFTKQKMDSFKEGKRVDLPSQISKYTKRFQGFAIISQGKNYSIVKDISVQSDKEFDNILRRIFYLILEFNTTIKDTLKTNDFTEIKRGMEIHNNITTFVSFCLRLLNKRTLPDVEKYNLYLLINFLDLMIDYNRWLCEDIVQIKKINKKVILLIHQVMDLFELFYHYYYNKKEETRKKFFHDRIKIKNELEKTVANHKEIVLITRYSCILEQMHFCMKSIIALEHTEQD